MREPSKGFTRELQVGVFIFAACLVIAAFSFRITDTPIFRHGTSLITYLDDATGVFKNSKVKMAGIDIGVIKEITLEGGKARIKMLINQDVDIPSNAQVIPRPLGILGDKYLEVVVPVEGPAKGGVLKDGQKIEPKEEPSDKSSWLKLEWNPIAVAHAEDAPAASAGTTSNEGASSADGGEKVIPVAAEGQAKKKKKVENLTEGQTIKAVNNSATLDDLTRQMGAVGQDLKAISGTLRQLIEGKEDLNTPVGRTLKNTEKLTSNMNDVVVENKKDLHEMVGALTRVSKKLERALDGFDERKVQNDIKKLADAVGNVNQSLENVQKITSRIEKGEGTLGKLVNDPTTVVELNRTLRVVNSMVDKASRTQTIVDLSTEYNFRPQESKTYVGLGIMPKEDTGYFAAVIVDAYGTYKTVVTKTSVNGGPQTVTEEITNDQSALKFSIQYYKRLWNLGFRLGIFENKGGLGLDLNFFDDRVKLGGELFNFSRPNENPHFKVYTKVNFWTYFYVIAGGDDLLSKQDNLRSFHAGLGMKFVDDDLKVLSLVPSVK